MFPPFHINLKSWTHLFHDAKQAVNKVKHAANKRVHGAEETTVCTRVRLLF